MWCSCIRRWFWFVPSDQLTDINLFINWNDRRRTFIKALRDSLWSDGRVEFSSRMNRSVRAALQRYPHKRWGPFVWWLTRLKSLLSSKMNRGFIIGRLGLELGNWWCHEGGETLRLVIESFLLFSSINGEDSDLDGPVLYLILMVMIILPDLQWPATYSSGSTRVDLLSYW